MTTNPVRPAAVLAVLLLAGLTTLPGSAATYKEALNPSPAFNACDAAVLDVEANWKLYPERTIPEAAAIWGVQRVYDACADPTVLLPPVGGRDDGGMPGEPTPPSDIVETLVANVLDTADRDKPKLRCTGGGMTLIGWNDEILLNGDPYSVARTPASSYWKIYTGYNERLVPIGHTRSLLDNIEGLLPETPQFAWQFAGLPMKEEKMLWSVSCIPGIGDIAGVVTSFSIQVEGSPFGVGSSILQIRAEGTTCLTPC